MLIIQFTCTLWQLLLKNTTEIQKVTVEIIMKNKFYEAKNAYGKNISVGVNRKNISILLRFFSLTLLPL